MDDDVACLLQLDPSTMSRPAVALDLEVAASGPISSCSEETHQRLRSDYELFRSETEAGGIQEAELADGLCVLELRHCRRCRSTLAWRLR